MNTEKELQTIEDIKNLFKDTKDYLKDYNEEDALNNLNIIADKLSDFDINTNLSDLGDSLDTELNSYYVTEDELEELIKQRLDDTGAQGVIYMLDSYDSNYNVHYMDDYGNIEDGNLYEELKDLLEDYQKEFEGIL